MVLREKWRISGDLEFSGFCVLKKTGSDGAVMQNVGRSVYDTRNASSVRRYE